jgi:hypothetical protein
MPIKLGDTAESGDPYHGTDIILFSHQSIGDCLAGFAMINDEGREALDPRCSRLHNRLSTTLNPIETGYDGLLTQVS